MLVANTQLNFTPSVTSGVLSNLVQVTIAGVQQPDVSLPATSGQTVIQVPSLAAVHVVVTPIQDFGPGVAATLDFTMEDLTQALPVTGLGYKVLSVVEVPDPTPTVAGGSGADTVAGGAGTDTVAAGAGGSGSTVSGASSGSQP